MWEIPVFYDSLLGFEEAGFDADVRLELRHPQPSRGNPYHHRIRAATELPQVLLRTHQLRGTFDFIYNLDIQYWVLVLNLFTPCFCPLFIFCVSTDSFVHADSVHTDSLFTSDSLAPIPLKYYLGFNLEIFIVFHFWNWQECVSSSGGEGGAQSCMWSELMQECMTPAYLPLHCANGECGRIIWGSPSSDPCPQPCARNKQCSTCLVQPGCGWCALLGKFTAAMDYEVPRANGQRRVLYVWMTKW